jgi:hypothetical protein
MTDDGDTESNDGGKRNSHPEERRLQSKLEAGTITEAEYARLTALRFGRDPEEFTFADAAELYDLTEAELRAEMAWLSEESR